MREEESMLEKKCGKCREFKGLSEFHVCRSSRDGLQGYCKVCNCAQLAEAVKGGRPKDKPWPQKLIGYNAAHMRVKLDRGSASLHACVDCGKPAKDWSYTGGDPEQVFEIKKGSRLAYSLKPEFYVSRCRKDHKEYDNALREQFAA